MKTENKLKVLEEMDLWEKEKEKYGAPDDRLARFFMQDSDDPNIFTMSGFLAIILSSTVSFSFSAR